MAKDDEITWEELNAYVDGELPPERASRLAEAVVGDRAIAHQVALLSRMKAGVAASVELPESLLRLPEPEHDRGAGRRARTALAAAVALLLLVGGASLWLRQSTPTTEPSRIASVAEAPLPGWLHQALDVHRALAAGRRLEATASQVASSFPGLLPDLSAARLTPGPVRPVTLPGLGRGAAVQYLGRHGCRVSLIALEELEESLPEPLRRTRRGNVEAYRWRVGAIGYLLLAEGMDRGRLRAIAETAYETTRRFRPPDAATRERLADARRRAAPCQA